MERGRMLTEGGAERIAPGRAKHPGREEWVGGLQGEGREKGAVLVQGSRIGRDKKGAGLWGLVGNEACDVTQTFLGGGTVICWFDWDLERACMSVAMQGCVSAAV